MVNKLENSDISLTRNQSLVIETLTRTGRPLGAYAILDELRNDGFKAPLQVYRTLDQLIALGLIHRLESMNAYVACQLEACEAKDSQNTSFVICEKCNFAHEFPSSTVLQAVALLLNNLDFNLTKSAIEIRGLCKSCQS